MACDTSKDEAGEDSITMHHRVLLRTGFLSLNASFEGGGRKLRDPRASAVPSDQLPCGSPARAAPRG
ncbi:transposase, degenerate [Burkholderia thailandensis E264]|uniref:Transposase, degenerate n=1 Tax=Burkholderia thailandensis (strain ATCC 700388 / DSM 13276 / CCUG 48851 / CIP 106301 / E264) TaxID=271848 RepID=Q2T358_BURTA|nr:transposase, degenerate [Burkholderia thailandensis E264]